ncbi:MAG: hypothetical protein IKK03_07830 [Lachnospiraceae bacterium]|nr:hypothetical protein [Lachnospiraceae bacterium]
MNPLMKIMQRLNVWTSELKNWHLGGICKGIVGHKSKELRSRQRGNTVEGIAYADKANIRLRSWYYKFIRHDKARNVAFVAIARELACFVWGMMTDKISSRQV